MIKSELLHVIAIIVYLVILIIGFKKHISLKKHLSLLLFNIYIVGVLSITLFPIPIQGMPAMVNGVSFVKNSFVPFADIISIINTHDFNIIGRQLGGNMILFIPLGYFIPIIHSKYSKFIRVLLIGFICSISIEILQVLISYLIVGSTYRSASVDDVLINTIGTAIGFVLFIFIAPISSYIFESPNEK